MSEISGNTVTNIIKGISRRLATNQPQSQYKLSWLQEKIFKHQEDRREKKVEIAGLIINYIRPYELLHTWQDIFENEIYKFTASSDHPLIIDCGANIGISVLYYKTLYPAADVITFEPDRQNFQLLTKNIAENNLQQVILNEAAIWNENGTISFASNASEGSSIVLTIEGNNIVSVPSVRLADLLAKYEKIDFLKIDIEGAENKVIDDCSHLLSKVENLFLEYHGTVDETEKLTGILKIITDAGFKCYLTTAANHLHHPFSEKRTGNRHDVQLNLFCYR
jgi:FkbM family methyltransferase